MKDFIASEKFLIGSNGQIGGVAPNTVNDIIKWDGTKWIAGVNPGGSGGGEGSYVANPFSTNLISGQSIQGILFGQALDSAPSIATDLEIDGDGSIIPYTISGINTTGYTAIFAEEIPNNNYKIHTVFGGGGGGGSSSSYWETGASDLYYNDNNVNIQRDLTIGGNLTVNGTQTIVNTETVEIEDHNLVIGANTHYTGFANPYPGAGDAYAGILWGTGDAGAASSVGLTYQSNKGFAFEGGNVGIGTASPDYKLDVHGWINAQADALSSDAVINLAGSNASAYSAISRIKSTSESDSNAASSLTFYTRAANNSINEHMRIDSAGNVGIGTTSPFAKLHLQGSKAVASANVEDQLIFHRGFNSGVQDTRFGALSFGTSGNLGHAGRLDFKLSSSYATPGSVPTNLGDVTTVMTLDGSGKVGIGTTNPGRKLEVVGGSSLAIADFKSDSHQADSFLYITNTSTPVSTELGSSATLSLSLHNQAGGKISAISTSDYTTNGNSNCALAFSTAFGNSSIERMRITSAGHVGIGTTSPDFQLHVQKSSTAARIVVMGDTMAGAGWGSYLNSSNDQSGTIRSAVLGTYRPTTSVNHSGVIILHQRNGGVGHLWIDDTSDLRVSASSAHVGSQAGTVVGDQTSDERLKNIESSFEYGLEQVMQLQPIAYTFKDDEDETRRLGFGAQTTQDIVPEVVYDTQECVDGYDVNPEDEDKQTARSEDTKFAMKYVELVPVLTKAIQEQQTIINDLKSRIETLEQK